MTTSPNSTLTTPPRSVNVACWLFLAVALLHLIGIFVGAAAIKGAAATDKARLTHSGSGISNSQANSLIGATVASAIIIGVLFIIAFVLFDVFMRRGANWARIVLLVLTVLSLIGVAGDYGIGAAGVVAAVIATILMFLRPSNEYFRAAKARKLGAAAPQA